MIRRFVALLLFATTVHAAEVTRAARWEMHSSFWMNLHQTLMRDASSEARDTSALSAEERAAWDAAISVYRQSAEGGSITFSQRMVALQDDLTQVADDAVNPRVEGSVADALKSAAPVYR